VESSCLQTADFTEDEGHSHEIVLLVDSMEGILGKVTKTAFAHLVRNTPACQEVLRMQSKTFARSGPWKNFEAWMRTTSVYNPELKHM
jgi:hypothetical protein